MYWNGGYESMSELSKMCVKSWKVYNSDWEFRLVDDSSVSEYFDLKSWMKNTLPNDKPLLDGCKKSEVLRINLINKYGGVYADADVFCCKPLDEWIHNMNPLGNFVALELLYDKLMTGNERQVESWFLASKQNSYISEKYCSEVDNYWKTRNKTKTYFWFHYLFSKMYKSDECVRRHYDSCKKLSAWKCSSLRDCKWDRTPFYKKPGPNVYERLMTKQEPIYKLNRRDEVFDWNKPIGKRKKIGNFEEGCVLDILINLMNEYTNNDS